ncbi:MAG: cytochrome c [Chloroflexi bacterium]|nr:cytochrome c [Chloroflexota bacterium]
MVGLLTISAFAVSACAVQETNTYPVEIFSEMHYSQAYGMQEAPRLAPLSDSVVFASAGHPDSVLRVPDKRERAYDSEVAGNLYRINCSVCHGETGLGDGKAARHLTSTKSFWTSDTKNNSLGEIYKGPPDLVDSAATRLTDRNTMVSFVSGGGRVMPSFGKLLSEEDIRDIVNYIFDESTGLSR